MGRAPNEILNKFLVVVVVYATIALGYLLVNHLVGSRRLFQLWTPLDEWWPFDQRFIWIYLLVYVTPLTILFFIRCLEDLYRAAIALLLNVAVAFPTFALFPVTFPRPSQALSGSWSGRMTAFVWRIDKPINCFPSIHVSRAFTAAFVVMRFHRSGGLAILLVAIAISVSTLFVKQHYIADIAAGFLLGCASFRLTFDTGVMARIFPFGQTGADPSRSA